MTRPFLVLLLALVLTAAGCGTTAVQRRQHFVTKASGVCRHFETMQNEVQFPAVSPVDAATSHAARAEWGVALKQVADLGTQEVRALRKLSAPKGLRVQFADFLAAKEHAFDLLLAGADAAKRNRPALVRTRVNAGRATLARAASLAKAAGVAECAKY